MISHREGTTIGFIRHRLLLPISLSAALLLGACGGADTTEASSGNETEYESPLYDYMGFDSSFDFSDEEEAQAQIEAQQREINEQVVACMAAEGFEYIPDDQDTVFFGGETEDGLEWGSDEWVAKYGFGVSTQAFPQEMVGPELIGMDESMFMDEEHNDPNEEYVQSLSEADRDAYYAALHGNDPGPDISEDMTQDEIDAAFQEWDANREPTGCQEMAWRDSDLSGGEDEFYREFGSELEDMWEKIQSHPKVVAAEREISECVSGKGFTYTNMNDVYEEYNERMEPLWDIAYAEPEVIPSEEELNSMSDEELDAIFGGPQELSEEAKSQLAEIQADEIALATAVNECGGGFDSNQEIYDEVRIELEQEFVDANRDRLDEFRASQVEEG